MKFIKNWYHLSKSFLGDNIILQPKVPESAVVEIEGDIPRICVSSHILKCLRSLISTKKLFDENIILEFAESKRILNSKKYIKGYIQNPCIYYTFNNPAYLPPDSSDYRNNDEHWFLTPTQFHYFGRIDIKKLIFDNILESIEEEYTYIIFTKNKEKHEITTTNIKNNIFIY